MTTNHTPGPWTQAEFSQTDVVTDDDTMIAMAREGLNGISRDQAIANARLIAAAPDLLAALREIEALDESVIGINRIEYARNVARAAIAKATGQ